MIGFTTHTPDEIIAYLTQKKINVPAWSALKTDYDPELHRITNDHTGRTDKLRKDGTVDKAARIHIGLEKLLTSRTNEFMFATPVKRIYHNIEGNETRQAIAKAMEAVYKHARIDNENKKRGIAYFASCEIFTLWYVTESPNSLYGFDSKYKIKCKTFSQMDGVSLYPLFDEYGDMTAMSLQYEREEDGKAVTYFDAYTADRHAKWRKEDGEWKELMNENIRVVGKIPGVYLYQPTPVWHGLSHIREEIEYTLSRNSDVIAYNSAPILKVVGSIQGKEDKGETQRVLRVEPGGDVGYVSWNQATEALKYQISTMLNLFWTQGQMPDISFEQMKSLGNIGYDARQTLFMDAHLKVGDESGAWIEGFEREANVIKAFLKVMNQSWAGEIDNVEVEHVISPFIQNDEAAEIQKWKNANGGKPVVSQLESIQNLGISNDPAKTLELIIAEGGNDNKTNHETET